MKAHINKTGARVKLYPGEPYLFILDPVGPVYRELDRRMTPVQLEAKRLVRKRTGKLAASIRKNRKDIARLPTVNVVAGGKGINYTGYEHDGTPPHVIRARRKKALRFQVGGQVVFRKQVQHPGTTGTFFLARALPLAGR